MPKNLSEWESYLTPFFNQINLLGEIPLTHDQIEEIGQEIRGLIQHNKLSKTTKMLDNLYYRTFATYLVHVAAHNTERNYWGVIESNLGVAKNAPTQQSWKLNFIKTLKEFNLPTFESVGGYRYVTPIRLHAGIPAYSLPDFFEQILLPSVEQSRFAELPTAELIEEMLGRSTVRMFVDSSVRYFLEFGQKHARDYVLKFVEKCQEMARYYFRHYDLLSPAELNLPPYVVRAFRQFMEDGRDVKTGQRMRPPYISLDPSVPEFYLHLPQQPVEGIYAAQTHYWKIEGYGVDGKEEFKRVERVRVRQRGRKFVTASSDIPLDIPASYLQISFCRQKFNDENSPSSHEDTLFTRRLHLLPTSDQPRLLAFHPHNGRRLSWVLSIPSDDYWLLYPRSAKLHAENALQLEEFPEFYGDWEDWQLGRWDLSKTNTIHLLDEEGELLSLIPVQERVAKPELVGGHILPQTVDPDDIPLYIGEPPRLRIPIQIGRTLEQELSRWRINFTSRWAANPVLDNQSYALIDFVDQVEGKGNAFELRLVALLGNQPTGSYEGVVYGPTGSRIPFRFRIWPKLEIDGLEPYYLPNQEGAAEVQFSAILPEGCQIQPQTEGEGITVTSVGAQYSITVSPELSLAELYLVMPQINQDSVRVSLSLAVPRLRWAFPQGAHEREMVWYTSPIMRSVDAILQASQEGNLTALHVELPSLAIEYSLLFALRLIDPESGEHYHESSNTHDAHHLRTRWRFPLGQYTDDLRNLRDLPVFEFQLVILDERTNKTSETPLLRLNRTLDISFKWIEHLDPPTFCLYWDEPRPLRNRRVRIWSEWQPWNHPVEIKIPDDANGEFLVTETGLPPSRYLLHFFTATPWYPKEPPADPPKDSCLAETTTPQNQLKWLASQLKQFPEREFLLRFERACIYATLKDQDRCNTETTWCYQNLNKATPEQIIALHRWVGKRDKATQSAIRIQMYRPKNLASLFQTFPRTNSMHKAYLQYLPNTKIVKLESARMLLKHKIDTILALHCLHILLNQEDSQGIVHICQRVMKGQLSDDDALALMKQKGVFSLETLCTLNPTTTITRLITKLARTVPDQRIFITTNHWVLTDAGWGGIEKIQDFETQAELPYFSAKSDTPLLSIALRPQTSTEKIMLDIAEQNLSFVGAEEIYICGYDDCRFATADSSLLDEHNRQAHNGIHLKYRLVSSETFRVRKPTYYAIDAPENELSGK